MFPNSCPEMLKDAVVVIFVCKFEDVVVVKYFFQPRAGYGMKVPPNQKRAEPPERAEYIFRHKNSSSSWNFAGEFFLLI